jgi:hypothetical protein
MLAEKRLPGQRRPARHRRDGRVRHGDVVGAGTQRLSVVGGVPWPVSHQGLRSGSN